MTRWKIIAIGFLVLFFGTDCRTVHRLDITAQELREELLHRDPNLSKEDIVVPYELSPKWLVKARSFTSGSRSDAEKVYLLIEALSSPRGFELHYATGVTSSAEETLKKLEGNCLSLASVFVGLARGLGLRAYFADFSIRMQNVYKEENLVVKTGHVAAVVDTVSGMMTMDFGRQINQEANYRIIDDFEATAHFYNNRGYDLIYQALKNNLAIDWVEVAKNFEMATKVRPDFVRAWNNLGVAYSRLGKPDKAMESYRKALSYDPKFSSAAYNLGVLYLTKNQLELALSFFEKAENLDTKNPRVYYQKALVLSRLQKWEEAKPAIDRACELDKKNKKAKELQQEIEKAIKL